MTSGFLSPSELTRLIQSARETSSSTTDEETREALLRLEKDLVSMKVSSEELENLEGEFHRGSVTEDRYFVQRKKLATDYFEAENAIPGGVVQPIIDKVEPEQQKSVFRDIRKIFANNKDVVMGVTQLLIELAKLHSGSA